MLWDCNSDRNDVQNYSFLVAWQPIEPITRPASSSFQGLIVQE